MSLERLQQRIGYNFSDIELLNQALTHVSYGHEKLIHLPLSKRDNERMEFMGDSVLSVVISDLLLEAFPDAPEGQLSRMRAAIVNERTLTEVSESLQIGVLIRLGRGERMTGGAKKPSILSSTFEALVAAIYIDGGFHAVYPVVREIFSTLFKEEVTRLHHPDAKTRLQEELQGRYRVTPTYAVIDSQGPDHQKKFTVEVRMKDVLLGCASGSSKKEAEQAAAREALVRVGEEDFVPGANHE
jgi:ribonuclease III